jgi:DedD protein
MAFFKFPWANQPQEPAKASSGRSRAPRGESIEELRRRARQRLIGAVILVLVGVIVFPLVFDTEPRTVPVRVNIDIPDRNASAPLAVQGASAAADNGQAAADAGLVAGEEQVDGNPPKAAAAVAAPPPIPIPVPAPVQAPAPSARPPAAVAPEIKSEPRTTPQAESKAEHKAEPKPKSEVSAAAPKKPHGASEPTSSAANGDAARARALLEGHAPTAVAAAPAASAQGERVVVQVGAYADQGKVREVRARLERAGIKSYAQEIQGKDGTRTTRVRVGPFASRAEAAKALGRIKGLGLDGVVLAL